MKDKFLSWLNLVLVADVFLVLFGFGWLAVAVVGKTVGVPMGLDLWYKLWQPVFNPALGILMAGAIMSGIINWVSRKFLTTGN
ncbi:hypothetical protein [Mastigocladopsis repens]|uniref:hypothetical protein n=1 Tax=Mastigocladopsis repens TaxID=221287 RepID=UPI00030A153D|nr:hypothetical protein [Mastigocladopsis repens]